MDNLKRFLSEASKAYKQGDMTAAASYVSLALGQFPEMDEGQDAELYEKLFKRISEK
jgi:hypothetical protein